MAFINGPTGRQGGGVVPCAFPGFILLRVLGLFFRARPHEEEINADDQATTAHTDQKNGGFHERISEKGEVTNRLAKLRRNWDGVKYSDCGGEPNALHR